MTWTSKKPTKAGWYWWRQSDRHSPIVRFWNGDMSEFYYGEWAGPLEPPT